MTSSVIYYSTAERKNEIYLFNINLVNYSIVHQTHLNMKYDRSRNSLET